jgi:hypothetical protein
MVSANISLCLHQHCTIAFVMWGCQGPYHYETVSGFVCEAFGFIPRTGESTKVVLRRADVEEGSERRDGETDQQEERRDKFQKFRLEVKYCIFLWTDQSHT